MTSLWSRITAAVPSHQPEIPIAPMRNNDLATTHPDIAAMWHPRMNKFLKPTGVQAISRKLVW